MEQEKNEMEILFPFNEVELAGEKINLRPFVFGKWPEVISKAAGIVNIILDAIQKYGDKVLDVSLKKDNFRISPQAYELLFKLIDEGGNNLYDILAISARKEREWVDNLEGEDGIKLLVGTFVVNKDFFIKKVAPQLQSMKMGNKEKTVPPGERLHKH